MKNYEIIKAKYSAKDIAILMASAYADGAMSIILSEEDDFMTKEEAQQEIKDYLKTSEGKFVIQTYYQYLMEEENGEL